MTTHKTIAGAAALAALTPFALTIETEVKGGDEVPQTPSFHAPVPMMADGQPIRVEAPGYACPAWHDVNGDGHADLVVGQFAGGKMAVYKGTETGELSQRVWLQADGKVAEVPGVW